MKPANHSPPAARPVQDEFMDADMRRIWNAMSPLPNDLRLYGGTALALYLNHRASVDFDFATPGFVDLDIAANKQVKKWLGDARVSGGPGMIDAYIQGKTRQVTVTFLECGHFIPVPRHDPIPAANGVMIADPRDIIAAKYKVVMERGAAYDYQDAAAFISAWPEWAMQQLHESANYTMPQIVYRLDNPPVEEAGNLTAEQQAILKDFGNNALCSQRRGQ